MQIRLNIYERGYQGIKMGKAFEPEVWHRVEFLEKNFIRFFSDNYLTEELYVEVSSTKTALSSFSFEFNGSHIEIVTSTVRNLEKLGT
jgi:hypothetical protein